MCAFENVSAPSSAISNNSQHSILLEGKGKATQARGETQKLWSPSQCQGTLKLLCASLFTRFLAKWLFYLSLWKLLQKKKQITSQQTLLDALSHAWRKCRAAASIKSPRSELKKPLNITWCRVQLYNTNPALCFGFILINYQQSHFTDTLVRVQMENLGSQMCGASLRLTELQAKCKLIILKPG